MFDMVSIKRYRPMSSLSNTQNGRLRDDDLLAYNGFNYLLYRQAPRETTKSVATFSTDINPNAVTKKDIILALTSDQNKNEITQRLVSQVVLNATINVAHIKSEISKLLQGWVDMGKFNKLDQFLSLNSMIDYYNAEFIRDFKDMIIPFHPEQVKSVVNPNGMYVQQTRTLSYKSKPPPFWERSLYKRLEDRTRDLPIDESENYFMKHKLTGKELPPRARSDGIFEREEPAYRLLHAQSHQ